MKHCNPCNTTKPRDQFHRRAASADGLAARCKACQKIYDKARASEPERVAARKAYQATDHGKARMRVGTAAWRKRNRIKSNAHTAVARALRKGTLVRKPCEEPGCGRTDYVEAHHDDYTKPLEVKWLCDPHHKKRHVELREQGKEP